LHPAAEQWIGLINGELACHTGIIQFPKRKGWKRVHRMVVLPDYQGIGIGIKFINEVSKHYIENSFNMNLTTTTPALVGGLSRNDKWSLVRANRVKTTWANFKKYNTDVKKGSKSMEALAKKSSINRITYSFNFKK
jgi:GNAT superfamily N-acetyltransferase